MLSLPKRVTFSSAPAPGAAGRKASWGPTASRTLNGLEQGRRGNVNRRFHLTHILVVCESKGSLFKTTTTGKKNACLGKTRMVKHSLLEFIFPKGGCWIGKAASPGFGNSVRAPAQTPKSLQSLLSWK